MCQKKDPKAKSKAKDRSDRTDATRKTIKLKTRPELGPIVCQRKDPKAKSRARGWFDCAGRKA